MGRFNLNMITCMSQNLVNLVDFVFHSQRRLAISNICMSQSGANLVDFGFSPIEDPIAVGVGFKNCFAHDQHGKEVTPSRNFSA